EPHNINNVLISCYYCNCRHNPCFDQVNKICNSGCHKQPKFTLHKKNLESNQISKYKLTEEEFLTFENNIIPTDCSEIEHFTDSNPLYFLICRIDTCFICNKIIIE